MKKNLLKYYQLQNQKLQENLTKVKENFDEEALHDLRVSIKKIKALYELMDCLLEKEYFISKKFLPYKNLFKAAGKLRDIHVQQGLIRKRVKK
ncbi:CHAD domain-containing protein, partial [Xanthovirga aplysinae]|uniref:CHAD domain-containing protein n=1 Tax=Xanthovirga aplysinae TaxID=2529853 RepID=UPI0016570860